MRVPSLSPYTRHHFQINPYFSLSISLLVLICKRLAHSWQPQKSFRFLQNLVYELRKYAIPLSDLGNRYAKVSHSGSRELVRGVFGGRKNPVTMIPTLQVNQSPLK